VRQINDRSNCRIRITGVVAAYDVDVAAADAGAAAELNNFP